MIPWPPTFSAMLVPHHFLLSFSPSLLFPLRLLQSAVSLLHLFGQVAFLPRVERVDVDNYHPLELKPDVITAGLHGDQGNAQGLLYWYLLREGFAALLTMSPVLTPSVKWRLGWGAGRLCTNGFSAFH